MFGYININQKELTEEGKKAYQAYYCGLCRQLKSNCGTKGQGVSGLTDNLFTPDKLEFKKDANMLKGGLVYADYITTVSDKIGRASCRERV